MIGHWTETEKSDGIGRDGYTGLRCAGEVSSVVNDARGVEGGAFKSVSVTRERKADSGAHRFSNIERSWRLTF